MGLPASIMGVAILATVAIGGSALIAKSWNFAVLMVWD